MKIRQALREFHGTRARLDFIGGEDRGLVLCRPFRAYELDNLRDQLSWHDHNCLAFGAKSSFVFRDLFVLGLIVVVLGKLADSLFVPSRGKHLLFFPRHFFFFR
jgi:hypothetical protein